MNYDIIFENERGFTIRYNNETLGLIIFDCGVNYYACLENILKIEDIERMNFVTFDLTKEERKEINKKLITTIILLKN